MIDEVGDRYFITLAISDRTEYSNLNDAIDARLSFSDQGIDLDPTQTDGWISGKDAVLQGLQVLLGSNRGQWPISPDFGSYLFKYYQDHHHDHNLLQRLVKLEISRLTSIPDSEVIYSPIQSIPISAVEWVESVKVSGHSANLLDVELRLYFADKSYFSGCIEIPASLA